MNEKRTDANSIHFNDLLTPVIGSTEGFDQKAKDIHAWLVEAFNHSGKPIRVQDLAIPFGQRHKVLDQRIPPRQHIAALVDASLITIERVGS